MQMLTVYFAFPCFSISSLPSALFPRGIHPLDRFQPNPLGVLILNVFSRNDAGLVFLRHPCDRSWFFRLLVQVSADPWSCNETFLGCTADVALEHKVGFGLIVSP